MAEEKDTTRKDRTAEGSQANGTDRETNTNGTKKTDRKSKENRSNKTDRKDNKSDTQKKDRKSDRKQEKRRKRILIGVIAAAIAAAIVAVVVVKVVKKYSSSSEVTDYASYYGLDGEDDLFISYDNTVLSETAVLSDGEIYIPFTVVQDYLNDRFYWDETEEILRYTIPGESTVNVEGYTAAYSIGKSAYTWDTAILLEEDDTLYLSLTFLAQYTDIRYTYYEDPNRIVISDEWGTFTYTAVKKSSQVRQLGGVKSEILTEVAKGDLLVVLEEMDTWAKVCTEDGFVGYIKLDALGDTQEVTYESTYVEAEADHITYDETICMAWHQVTNSTANSQVEDVLEAAGETVNVISPTWFYLNDDEGGIASLASSDYVTYCHSLGIEVWALVSNFEEEDVDTAQVLSVTTYRETLINNLVSEAIKYNLDGINVDFESLDADCADAFLQFIRELSLKCAANEIVLSVDNYVPTSYNSFYDVEEQAVYADYVVLMAYDEHYAGSSDAGSVSSISYVETSVATILDQVDNAQVILGLPFYTRFWKTYTDEDGAEQVESEALGMSEAEERIAKNDATWEWSDEYGQYYSEFEYNDALYQIWLEDTTSLALKLDVMSANELAGCSFWKLGYEKDEVWETIAAYLE